MQRYDVYGRPVGRYIVNYRSGCHVEGQPARWGYGSAVTDDPAEWIYDHTWAEVVSVYDTTTHGGHAW